MELYQTVPFLPSASRRNSESNLKNVPPSNWYSVLQKSLCTLATDRLIACPTFAIAITKQRASSTSAMARSVLFSAEARNRSGEKRKSGGFFLFLQCANQFWRAANARAKKSKSAACQNRTKRTARKEARACAMKSMMPLTAGYVKNNRTTNGRRKWCQIYLFFSSDRLILESTETKLNYNWCVSHSSNKE